MTARGGIYGFSDVYGTLLTWLLGSPVEHNERTGRAIHVGRGGTSFRVDLADGSLPTCGLRRTFPRTAAAETAWYLKGDRDLTWLRQYAPIWDKFAETIKVPTYEDDVYTGDESYQGITAAYGYRWRRHFKRDQLGLAIEALRKNPSDRRVLVAAWDPSQDGLGAERQMNVPCPDSFTFSITEGELHSTMRLRSSDVFVGLPYDVMGHALLVDAVAKSIGVRPGVLQFSISHAHLYDTHWAMAEECIAKAALGFEPALPLPGWSVEQIVEQPDAYVAQVTTDSKAVDWPLYAPRPDVVL